jgi:hypothetical protein
MKDCFIVHKYLLNYCRRKIILEISRKKLREEVLERIKYVQTCVLAREVCLLVRTNRAVLNPKDVQEICLSISKLCKERECDEASELCRKAAEAIGTGDEEKYLELCAQSCMKCGEARRPTPKKATYVA